MSGYISEDNRLGAEVRGCGSDIEDFIISVEVNYLLFVGKVKSFPIRSLNFKLSHLELARVK